MLGYLAPAPDNGSDHNDWFVWLVTMRYASDQIVLEQIRSLLAYYEASSLRVDVPFTNT